MWANRVAGFLLEFAADLRCYVKILAKCCGRLLDAVWSLSLLNSHGHVLTVIAQKMGHGMTA